MSFIPYFKSVEIYIDKNIRGCVTICKYICSLLETILHSSQCIIHCILNHNRQSEILSNAFE